MTSIWWLLRPCAVALLAVAGEGADDLPARAVVCADVTVQAVAHGVSPALAVSLAFHESRLDAGAVSRAGAVGPMQVIPRWWCPGGALSGCDVVGAGVAALRTLTDAHGRLEGVARYNAGNRPGERAWRYARTVTRWIQ